MILNCIFNKKGRDDLVACVDQIYDGKRLRITRSLIDVHQQQPILYSLVIWGTFMSEAIAQVVLFNDESLRDSCRVFGI